jgi:membrane fusion protein, multidrug efflux system
MHDVAKPVSTEDKVRPRRGAMGVAIGGLVTLVIILVGIKVMQIAKMMSTPMQMPATTVTSAVAKEEDWAPALSSVGSVSAVQGAIVSAELGGIVSEVGFESGAVAKKGDVLLRLDTSSEQAQLRTAEADLELARADLERSRGLATRKVISKAELDSAESKFK